MAEKDIPTVWVTPREDGVVDSEAIQAAIDSLPIGGRIILGTRQNPLARLSKWFKRLFPQPEYRGQPKRTPLRQPKDPNG